MRYFYTEIDGAFLVLNETKREGELVITTSCSTIGFAEQAARHGNEKGLDPDTLISLVQKEEDVQAQQDEELIN